MTAKEKVWAAVAITIVSVGIFAPHYLFPKDPDRTFLNRAQTGWSYVRGYFAGIGWAKADLEENRALIMGGGPMLDQETGPRTWGLDCTVDRGMEGVADGYNRIVRLWVRLKGSPPYSRKQWEGILFHLTEYFDKRAQTEPPENFVVDGPPILASDGITKVSLKFRKPDTYLITWDTKIKSPFWSPLLDPQAVETRPESVGRARGPGRDAPDQEVPDARRASRNHIGTLAGSGAARKFRVPGPDAH
jgi:hypothetical protein